MQSEISPAIVFSVLIAVFLALYIPSQEAYANADSGVVVATQNAASASMEDSGIPKRLRIPKINVDTTIESVGLTPQGAMEAPAGPSGVAWFNLGPQPGEHGTAVIDGHSGWKNGIPAIFDNLNQLQKGDRIYVEDEAGRTTTFVVREVRTYGKNEDPSDVFSSSDGKAHLNLITCKGVWNSAEKSYSDRLVVFTDREME